MKLEDQVCSLDVAKKLNELGVKQESLFYWQNFQSMGERKWAISNTTNGKSASAFTVAELGMMLPLYWASWRIPRGLWAIDDVGNEGDAPDGRNARTEADTRAKMLIYLIENNLIKVEQTNDSNA